MASALRNEASEDELRYVILPRLTHHPSNIDLYKIYQSLYTKSKGMKINREARREVHRCNGAGYDKAGRNHARRQNFIIMTSKSESGRPGLTREP